MAAVVSQKQRSVRRLRYLLTTVVGALILLLGAQRLVVGVGSPPAMPLDPDVPEQETTVSFQDGFDEYSGTQDTIMKGGAPTTAFGDLEMIGWDSSAEEAGDLWNSAFLRFDGIIGGGEGQVPNGAIVTKATIELHIYDSGEDAAIHPARMSWDETTARDQYGGQIGSVLDVVPGSIGLATVDVSSWAALWPTSQVANHGFMIMASGPDGVYARSSEYAEVGERPRLVITYLPPGTNSAGGNQPDWTSTSLEPSPTTLREGDE